MKILQLCTRVPFPPIDGGSIAMYTMQQALHMNGAELKVLSFNTIKQYSDPDKWPAAYREMTETETVFLDNRIKPFSAFINLFSGESYHIIRFIRRDFEEKLIEILKKDQFDVVQMESLFMVPYLEAIRKKSDALIILRTHNIEHQIWERLANTETNQLKRWYLQLLAKRLRHYEYWAFNSVDGILAMTNEDCLQMKDSGINVPIKIAPVGIDLSRYPPEYGLAPILFHLGAMDWMPNQDGMRWFVKEVWPELKARHSSLRFRFAGKKMPEEFLKYRDERCEVDEFVPDAKAYMQQGQIMIVPLFSGSGMRVKIIEGLALGKTIISTSIGLEGIPYTHGLDAFKADTKEEFIDVINQLMSTPALMTEVGKRARLLAEHYFDNRQVGKTIMDYYAFRLQEKRDR